MIKQQFKYKAMAPHSSTLAWKTPWTEEPGRLLSMGSLRVGHECAISLSLFTFLHWRRKWQPTPVFLPGESQGRGSLVGCRLWGRRVGHDWSNLAASLCNTLGHREIVDNEVERVVWAQIVEGFYWLARQPEHDFHVAVNGKPLLAFEEERGWSLG